MCHCYCAMTQQQLQEQQPQSRHTAHVTQHECFISTMHAAEANHTAQNSSDNNINKQQKRYSSVRQSRGTCIAIKLLLSLRTPPAHYVRVTPSCTPAQRDFQWALQCHACQPCCLQLLCKHCVKPKHPHPSSARQSSDIHSLSRACLYVPSVRCIDANVHSKRSQHI